MMSCSEIPFDDNVDNICAAIEHSGIEDYNRNGRSFNPFDSNNENFNSFSKTKSSKNDSYNPFDDDCD